MTGGARTRSGVCAQAVVGPTTTRPLPPALSHRASGGWLLVHMLSAQPLLSDLVPQAAAVCAWLRVYEALGGRVASV